MLCNTNHNMNAFIIKKKSTEHVIKMQETAALVCVCGKKCMQDLQLEIKTGEKVRSYPLSRLDCWATGSQHFAFHSSALQFFKSPTTSLPIKTINIGFDPFTTLSIETLKGVACTTHVCRPDVGIKKLKCRPHVLLDNQVGRLFCSAIWRRYATTASSRGVHPDTAQLGENCAILQEYIP